jgi:hypothetical protein
MDDFIKNLPVIMSALTTLMAAVTTMIVVLRHKQTDAKIEQLPEEIKKKLNGT